MLLDSSISQLLKLLRSKEVSVVDVITESLNHVQSLNPQLHDFINTKSPESALAEAKKLDKQFEQLKAAPLFGLPYSLKDAYNTTDLKTTAGSKILKDFNSPYDATVQLKLKQAGGILIGKNSQDAFGHGGSSENTDFEIVRNPWNLDHVAGGSSGGCAVSVAARSTAFAIGEDTGGSIRNPASMCNVTGLKVTYGRVSRYGAIAYASSLDTIGPMAKSAADIAAVLEVIAGRDPLDATSSAETVPQYSQFLGQNIKGKVIGIPQEFFDEGLNPETLKTTQDAIATFKSLGAIIKEVSIPYQKYGIPIYYLLAWSETSSNLARFDGIRYGTNRQDFTPENMRRIMVGTFALSAGYADDLYKNAQKARTRLIEEYQKVFEECDILLAPVTPSPAAKLGELINDPMKNLLEDLYTVTINTVGVPSLAIPAGFSASGLPIGIQLIGKKFHEGELLQFGDAYQQITDWHSQKPPTTKKL